MSRKTILRITGLVLAICFGVAFGQLAGVLMAKGKAVVVTVHDVTRGLTFEVPAPSDNVVDWLAEPITPTQRPRSARRISHEMHEDRGEDTETGTQR